jgi:hypothetical protein
MIYSAALTLRGIIENECQLKGVPYVEKYEMDGTGLSIVSIAGDKKDGITIRTLLITHFDIDSNVHFLRHFTELITAISRTEK